VINLQESKKRLRSLYLRWRPSRFAEVVGQNSTVRILRNSVIQGETSHAYLFAGPRGTGKTSVARLLAKAVNCEDSENGEPCNKCDSCRKIEKGTALDLVEIDGASNRGIDKIRELREEVNYSPAELKQKIYIIDEVHMLTTEAFNALLKTLEEPPDKVTFIFATTEPEKIPTTIISRCQVFEFTEIARPLIRKRLTKVVNEEGIDITDEAIDLISRRAKGSMRDGLVLLEQVSPYGSDGEIGKSDLIDLLGLASEASIVSFIESLEDGSARDMLDTIDDLAKRGRDLELFLDSVLEELRGRIVNRKDSQEIKYLVRLSRKILDLSDEVKRSSNKQVSLEIGGLEILSQSNRGEQGDEPDNRGAQTGGQDKDEDSGELTGPDAFPTGDSLTGQPEKSLQKPKNSAVDKPDREDETIASSQPEDGTSPDGGDGLKYTPEWRTMMKEIENDRISIAAFLEEAHPAIRNRDLILEFGRNFAFHKESLEESKTKDYLQKMVTEHFEDVDKVRIIYSENREQSTDKNEDLLEKKAKLVKRHFGGTIIEEGRFN